MIHYHYNAPAPCPGLGIPVLGTGRPVDLGNLDIFISTLETLNFDRNQIYD